MADSEPGGLEVEYNLSDPWFIDDETYIELEDEKLDKELTDLIPELIKNDVMFCEFTSPTESGICDAYFEYIVDVMENKRYDDPDDDYDYDIYD